MRKKLPTLADSFSRLSRWRG